MIGDDAFIDVAIGGGRRSFFNSTDVNFYGESGDRTDGRNLIEEAKDAGVLTASNSSDFSALQPEE